MSATAKVKDTAKEEVVRVAHLAEDAAKSGAYIYPLKVRSQSKHTCDSLLTMSTVGNLLFCLAPRAMEASPQQAGADSHTRNRHHNLHVPLHVPTASSYSGIHQRSSRSSQRLPAGS